MEEITLKLFQAPGDLVVFTNLIRDFKSQYQNISIKILSYYPEIVYNNPNLDNHSGKSIFNFSHEDIIQYRRPGEHISSVYYHILNAYGYDVKQTSLWPEIFLTEEEKDKEFLLRKFGLPKNYWIFNAGIKIDMPLKQWPIVYWKELIDNLTKNGIKLIQIGSNQDIHPVFESVSSLVGRTQNIRDLLPLFYHSLGVVSGISLPIHLAAAFKKPCVVIAGGREEPRYEMYNTHQFHHTVGMFNCCKTKGCWLSQRQECANMTDMDLPYPKCMMMIRPEEVAASVYSYELSDNLTRINDGF